MFFPVFDGLPWRCSRCTDQRTCLYTILKQPQITITGINVRIKTITAWDWYWIVNLRVVMCVNYNIH
jgi:hypothetical protein